MSAVLVNANGNGSAVSEKVLNDVQAKLRALKASFVIVTPDGRRVEFGDITPPNEKKKRKYTHKRGTFAKIYKAKIENMEVGDVRTFTTQELGDIHPYQFQSALCAAMCHKYGNKSAVTVIDKKTMSVETMRIL